MLAEALVKVSGKQDFPKLRDDLLVGNTVRVYYLKIEKPAQKIAQALW